jgi:tetratricopeptide (TPR) repeat protein
MQRRTAGSINSTLIAGRGPGFRPVRTGARRWRLAARWLLALGLYLPLTGMPLAADQAVMLPLLRGEFALQGGDLETAASAYLEAAQASGDPAVAERAARIALTADDAGRASAAVARWQTLQPDVPTQLAMRALLAVRAGDREAAVAELRRVAATPEGWTQALQILNTQPAGTIDAAVLEAMVDAPARPTELDATLTLGALLLRHGAAEAAGRLAAEATAAHPSAARAWLWQAEVERRRDQPETARSAIESALALPGLEPPARLAAAAQLDALGDPQAAARALADSEQDDATLAARAAYLARAEDEELLLALYDEIAAGAGPPSDSRRYLLGQLAELRRDSATALDWYGAISASPLREQGQLRVAILHDRAEQTEQALAILHRLQDSDSDHGDVLVDAYLLESELRRKRDDPTGALAALDRGLAVFEDDPELLYARALAYERVDRHGEAIADLRRLVALDPDNADALNALGYTLADRTAHYDEAHRLIERAHRIKPDNPAILDSLGWVLHKLGRSNEGLEHLRRSFAGHPDAEVAAHLGEVLWLLGRHDEAREAWEQGRGIDPAHPVLVRTLERFKP